MYYCINKTSFLLLLGLVFTSYSRAQTTADNQNADALRLGPVIYNPYGEADPTKQAYAILEERLKVKFQPLASGSQPLSTSDQLNNPDNLKAAQVSVKLLADLQDKNKRKQMASVANKSEILKFQSDAYAAEKQNDHAKAISSLFEAAQRGDQVSIFHIGYLLANGVGLSKDPKEALNWFKCAALIEEPVVPGNNIADSTWEFDRTAVIYHLGYAYFWGKDVSVNYTEAYNWFKMLDENLIASLTSLTKKYIDKKKPELPSEYFDAMAYLGVMYADGLGVGKNEKKALSYLKKSAETNSDDEILFYAELKSSLLCYKDVNVNGDYTQTFEWIKKAADRNDSMSEYIVGCLYETGKGTFRNMATAMQYYNKAADAGYIPAIERSAYIYDNGSGGLPDHKKALFWYMAAAKKDNSNDMYNCGAVYEMNSRLLTDREQQLYAALFWYRQAELYGNTKAKVDIKRLTDKLRASSKEPVDIDNYLKKGKLSFQVLPSGVRYYVAKPNNSLRPLPGDTVEFNVFSMPADFSGVPDKNEHLQNNDSKKSVSVIKDISRTSPGLGESLLCLREGEKGMFIIPAALSAGELDVTKTSPADKPFCTTFTFAEITKIRPVKH